MIKIIFALDEFHLDILNSIKNKKKGNLIPFTPGSHPSICPSIKFCT